MILTILGLYINQNPGGQGLDSWVNENGSIEDEDIVLYHSFGITKCLELTALVNISIYRQVSRTYRELKTFPLCRLSKTIYFQFLRC